jgi:hypothetical protein
MPRKTVKQDRLPGNEKLPDFGSMTPKVLEVFERGFAEKDHARETIERYASKPNPTVREMLLLAWFRNWLSFLGPKLPDGDSPTTAAGVWQYWVDHQDELLALTAVREEIISYLETRDQIEADKKQGHGQMVELIRDDQLTFMAWYPFVEELYAKKKRGAPAVRRLTAVQALQMQVDGNSLSKITRELCDCGMGNEVKHDERCEQQMRQSLISLRKLLQKCRIPLQP